MDPLAAAIASSLVGSVIGSALTPAPEPSPAALVRTMPQETRVGRMSPPVQSQMQWQVTIDGRVYPLSPGVQFRNEMNMIVTPAMIQQPAKVRYLVDAMGAVHRVWILSAAEARLPENR